MAMTLLKFMSYDIFNRTIEIIRICMEGDFGSKS